MEINNLYTTLLNNFIFSPHFDNEHIICSNLSDKKIMLKADNMRKRKNISIHLLIPKKKKYNFSIFIRICIFLYINKLIS